MTMDLQRLQTQRRVVPSSTQASVVPASDGHKAGMAHTAVPRAMRISVSELWHLCTCHCLVGVFVNRHGQGCGWLRISFHVVVRA